MQAKWQLNEEQLKKMLNVTNVVIGAAITEEQKDEASTCFEREGITDTNEQHQTDTSPTTQQTDDNA